jgi:hypothetical protein
VKVETVEQFGRGDPKTPSQTAQRLKADIP